MMKEVTATIYTADNFSVVLTELASLQSTHSAVKMAAEQQQHDDLLLEKHGY